MFYSLPTQSALWSSPYVAGSIDGGAFSSASAALKQALHQCIHTIAELGDWERVWRGLLSARSPLTREMAPLAGESLEASAVAHMVRPLWVLIDFLKHQGPQAFLAAPTLDILLASLAVPLPIPAALAAASLH